MSQLGTELEELKEAMSEGSGEEALRKQKELIARLRSLGVGKDALGTGAKVHDFTLPDQVGADVRLSDLLKLGDLVVSFFRGAWCPFCETELKALHMALPDIEARGARLIAISPQIIEKSMTMAERLLLDYSVLSDQGNHVAKEFGLAFEIPEEFREFHDDMADLEAYNRDLSYLLPIPATYVVDQTGTIRYAYVNVDYTERAEPEEVLKALDEIRGQ